MGGCDSIGETDDGAAVAAVIDQSPDLIAVLDCDGVIVLTNAAWRAAAEQRGASCATAGCELNDSNLCQWTDSAVISEGIRDVLVGARPRFELEYPWHSPIEDAWWSLEVVPLEGPQFGAVLTHTNITARHIVRRVQGHLRHVDPVTMLATSASQIAGLAGMLANAQLQGSSLAIVSITFPELSHFEARHGRRRREALIVQVVARVVRFARADDALIRPAPNGLALFASVADARAAEFLRERIAEVLGATYLVGADAFDVVASVSVAASDQFSTLASLLHGSSLGPEPVPPTSEASLGDADSDTNGSGESYLGMVPLMVYSLPGAVLQAANATARSLFGLKAKGDLSKEVVASPADLMNITAALAALNSGAADSYRAHRTLVTPDGPMVLLTAVRRLLVGASSVAVALTVPIDSDGDDPRKDEDPFAVALVAGTITDHGAVTSVSEPDSPIETKLVGALGGLDAPLKQAAHPDDADIVDTLLQSLRSSGEAAGAFRLPHSQDGWMLWQCQLFTIKRRHGRDSECRVVASDTHIFVLSAAAASAKSMADKIARLERHIRRIGSEVLAADLELTAPPSPDRHFGAVFDELELTARQRDIVERLASGQRVATIANALFISRSTVRNHLAQVFQQAGVHSQEELLNKLRAS